jgi:hypothetical protein
MNKPGLVSKSIVVCDVCEWVCDGDEYPEWKYSICSYKGHIFRWRSDGVLIEADDCEIMEAKRELELMAKQIDNVIGWLYEEANNPKSAYDNQFLYDAISILEEKFNR